MLFYSQNLFLQRTFCHLSIIFQLPRRFWFLNDILVECLPRASLFILRLFFAFSFFFFFNPFHFKLERETNKFRLPNASSTFTLSRDLMAASHIDFSMLLTSNAIDVISRDASFSKASKDEHRLWKRNQAHGHSNSQIQNYKGWMDEEEWNVITRERKKHETNISGGGRRSFRLWYTTFKWQWGVLCVGGLNHRLLQRCE